MHPLYLSIQGPCSATCQPTAIAFSATDPLVIGGDRVDEDVIHRAIAYALHGRSGWAEGQFPDTDWPCMQVTFVFWARGHAWEVRRTGARLADVTAREAACSLRRWTMPTRRRRPCTAYGESLDASANCSGEMARAYCRLAAGRRSTVGLSSLLSGRATLAPRSAGLNNSNCCANAPIRSGGETVRLRHETTVLHEATVVAGIAGARYHHARAALVEQTAMLRETRARHAAAIERLQRLRARCEPKTGDGVSARTVS